MKIMLINARSVKNKGCKLHDEIIDNDLDLFFITETWLSPYDTSAISDILPDSYEFFHFPRADRNGGGVGVAVSRCVKSVKCVNRCFTSFECLQATIVQDNQKVIFYLIYRPPNGSI